MKKTDFSNLELHELKVLAIALAEQLKIYKDSTIQVKMVIMRTAILFGLFGKTDPDKYSPIQKFLDVSDELMKVRINVAQYLREVIDEIEKREQEGN